MLSYASHVDNADQHFFYLLRTQSNGSSYCHNFAFTIPILSQSAQRCSFLSDKGLCAALSPLRHPSAPLKEQSMILNFHLHVVHCN